VEANDMGFKFNKTFFFAACLALGSQAFAQDTNVNVEGQGSNVNVQGKSEAQAEGKPAEGEIGITHFAIRPSAGALFFNGNERFAGGVLLDFNLMNRPDMKFGPATGALYSSLSGSNFLSGISAGNNDYIFQIPANLKYTYSPDQAHRWQFGVHGGANIIRTNIGEVFGGTTGEVVSAGQSSWDVHGNVGADVDFALNTNVDISLRPDVTFLSQYDAVTATLGLGVKL
jgi:hypothetical protein